VATRGVPLEPAAGEDRQHADFLCQRGRVAFGLPHRACLGSSGTDAGGATHRRAVFAADASHDKRPGRDARHVHEGSVDPFCEFRTRLAEGMKRKSYLVVGGNSIHKAGQVQKHLAALGSKITLSSLSPYSPELNADGWVRKQVKQRIAKQSVRTRDDLKQLALSALHSLQQVPEKIRGVFRVPAC
jgi:hypothetical protein